MECRHVWRPTTNSDGETDGVICIHCLAWRSFMDRLNGSVYINEARM